MLIKYQHTNSNVYMYILILNKAENTAIRHQLCFQDSVIILEYVSYNSLLHFLYAIIVIWKKMSFYSKFQNQLYENIQS